MSVAYSAFDETIMTEYGKLRKVIVCPPDHMKIKDVINETQKHFLEENIDIELASKQHNDFIKVMKNNYVEVLSIRPDKKFNEQVFTRDIGFTIGETVFVANMGCDVRKGEEKELITFLSNRGISFQSLQTNEIEGGDVIVDGKDIYVGVSERTTSSSVAYLQSLLPKNNVHPLPFNKKYLHLDCVFNILSDKEALIFKPAFKKEQVEELQERFHLIEVSDEEQFTLATNVLSIGEGKVISQPINKRVNEEMRNRGFHVIEVDFSELIKSGGSFRCCSMPLLRDN
ncbi:hypothetical protein Q75_01550 [Bacillus coahuilensis p1.1.43]|uniref:Arginine deiminase n=1 Tax=Bacillus coahuilensis p1.1.43 TaxID=1150625 RepID=A0A147KC68_9BACI|nr:dimethylarginine dimethylaminohydrolase family protein [Bacillus coahuilensis]KUP09146.1 hypothetical protein Q75_01550 [Bacillus coahuilensis p1.1.43]